MDYCMYITTIAVIGSCSFLCGKLHPKEHKPIPKVFAADSVKLPQPAKETAVYSQTHTQYISVSVLKEQSVYPIIECTVFIRMCTYIQKIHDFAVSILRTLSEQLLWTVYPHGVPL